MDKENKGVFVSDADRQDVPIAYDYLILATGASHSYFGRNEFEKFAPGMKSLADAVLQNANPCLVVDFLLDLR